MSLGFKRLTKWMVLLSSKADSHSPGHFPFFFETPNFNDVFTRPRSPENMHRANRNHKSYCDFTSYTLHCVISRFRRGARSLFFKDVTQI